MSEQFIAGPSQIYFATTAVLLLGTAAFAGLGLRQSGRRRRMTFAALVPMVSMALAYVLMGLELFTVEVTATGRSQSVARFVGYTLVLSTIVFFVRDLIDMSFRQTAITLGLFLVTPWASLVSWMLTGTGESLMNLVAILAYIVAAYLFFAPLSEHAKSVIAERRLLFAKIRNLFVLGTGTLILLAALSEQSLGLMDFFVGQVAASYVDLIFLYGISGLVYSGGSAFESRTDSSDDPPTGSNLPEETGQPADG